MQILIKLKEDSKFNSVSSSIGKFRKGIIYSIDSSKFDESIMEEIKPKEEGIPELKDIPEISEEIEIDLAKKELFKLNKKEQVSILKGFGAKKIPRLEKDRVNLILKLQA